MKPLCPVLVLAPDSHVSVSHSFEIILKEVMCFKSSEGHLIKISTLPKRLEFKEINNEKLKLEHENTLQKYRTK